MPKFEMDLLHHPEDIDRAGRPLSRIERQSLLIREPDKAGWAKLLRRLHEDFALANGGYVSRSLNPATLLEPKKGKRWKWDPFPGAGTDRVHYLRRYLQLSSILAEPEEATEVAAIRAYAERYGLRIDEPPHPYASFHNPGVSRFMVVSGPHAWMRTIKWLNEQLEFSTSRLPAPDEVSEVAPGELDYDGY